MGFNDLKVQPGKQEARVCTATVNVISKVEPAQCELRWYLSGLSLGPTFSNPAFSELHMHATKTCCLMHLEEM